MPKTTPGKAMPGKKADPGISPGKTGAPVKVPGRKAAPFKKVPPKKGG